MNIPLKGFIAYSHENSKAKDTLRAYLAVMEQQNKLVTWHDGDITTGDKARQEDILKEVADSDILLYLVSAWSLASENCNKELAEALKENLRIIPIILEACDWKHHKLSNFEVLPYKGRPINKWKPESDGWQNVVDGIRKAFEEMQTDIQEGILLEWMFEQGNFLMMIGQIDKAIEAYSHAIKLNPNNAAAYNNRGLAYIKHSEFDRAIADFNTTIELRPDLVAAYYNRGGAYYEKREYVRAIEDCNRAIRLKPDHPEPYNNRGMAYVKQKEYNRAIEDYNRAIDRKPHDADIYNNRGMAYGGKGEFDRAINDFNKAIKLKPDYVKAHRCRGIAYGENGEFDRAINDFSKAIELDPDDANSYYDRGLAYGKKGEVNLAIADFTKAIELKPDYAIAYNNRGNAYRDRGEVDRAVRDYNKAIQLKPNFADAYYSRGMAYINKGEIDHAIEDLNTTIKLKRDNADAYYNRGVAYGVKREYDLAILDYDKAIQFRSDYVEAYCNRGVTYCNKGEVDLAIADFNNAIQLKPDLAEAYINRGYAYGRKNGYSRAIEDYNTAINLKPTLAEAYNNRGVAYNKRGDYERAIIDYNTAIQLKPDYAEAYYNRGEVWLQQREWEKAREDLNTAKDKGVDIIAGLHNDYKRVEDFEKRHGVNLPADIAAMLTQRRRSRFPKTEKFLNSDGTPFESPDVLNLLVKLRNAGTPLSQYVQTRPTFGIKTGSSGAFVVDSAMRDQLIVEHPSSVEVLKPYLIGRDIRRWGVARPDSWLIFTYRGIEINRFPAIQKHLEKYRASLSKMAGKHEWYELPAGKLDAEFFTQTKLVCPNSYDHQTFAIDTEGFYCGDTCFLIPTEETWLCGLLNSRVVEWFYSQVSDQLTGDYLRARSGYMQQIPIPDLTSAQKSLIGKIVDYLIYLQGQPTTNSTNLAYARDAVMLKYFERIIDGLVYESYLREDLHHGGKHFFKPLVDERLPQIEEIRGDKMSALREIFERLYEKTHPVRRNLFFLDSVKPIRVIEGKA